MLPRPVLGGGWLVVEDFLGLVLNFTFCCNLFSDPPKLDLLQLSLPQPGHQQLHHCALGLGSFGTSWITCTSLIPWATSCSPKTASSKSPNPHTPLRKGLQVILGKGDLGVGVVEVSSPLILPNGLDGFFCGSIPVGY